MVADKEKKKRKIITSENDIYTALLGLAALVLSATVVLACLRSMELYDTIFKQLSP